MDADLSGRIGQADERFVPGTADGELIEVEHLARYLWASQLVRGRSVLDAGCGTGYGSALLARAGAADVVGIDLSAQAVEAASAGAPENTAFLVGDVHELSFEAGRFDVVVCFEVIEHVDRQDAVVAELARVLARDGLLAVSSPNRDVYPPGNPHHLHEYVPEELRAALAAHFDHVELHRQHAWLASAVFDDEEAADDSMRERTDVRIAKDVGRDPGSEPYTIALAGRAPVPESTSALVLGDLADTGLGAELARARAELATVRDIEAQLRDDVATLLGEVDDKRQELRNVYGSASWRLTEPLRRAKHLRRR